MTEIIPIGVQNQKKKNVKDDNSFNYNEFEDQEIKFDEKCFDLGHHAW